MYTSVKLFIISVNFRNPGFCSVLKPQKPVFLFRTGPTTTVPPNQCPYQVSTSYPLWFVRYNPDKLFPAACPPIQTPWVKTIPWQPLRAVPWKEFEVILKLRHNRIFMDVLILMIVTHNFENSNRKILFRFLLKNWFSFNVALNFADFTMISGHCL